MASFEDTVNALGPIFFFRMDDVTGTVMTDSSGNDLHGEYFATAVLGRPSPVETDPSSFAVGGAVGKLVTANGSLADVRGNFTWIVFGFLTEDTANDNNVLFCRNGQIGLSTGNWIAFNDGNIQLKVTIGGVATDIVASVSGLVRGSYYFIRGTRNGTTLKLHVNEQLIDAVSIAAGDIDAELWSTDGWYFGRSQSADVWYSPGTDEAIGFNYALSDAEALSILESSINAVLLSGVSNVIPTAILDGTDEPDPIQFPFRHNWSEDLIERISFKTDISQAISGPEEAKQIRPKPRREIEINQMLRDNSERRALRAKLWPNQHQKWFIPMLEYRDVIPSLASGATTIPIATPFKDYEIDSFVQIRQLNAAGQITQMETIQIPAFDADSVDVVTPIQNNYSGHVEVCPARRGYINLSSPRGHTAEVEDLVITARLLAEDEKTAPNRVTAFTPPETYKTYEVFKESLWQSNDWSELREYEIERDIVEVDSESGVFGVESDTPGAQEAFSYRIWIKGLELNASFLGWFYARAGALNYLWVPSMQRDFEPVSFSTNQVTIIDHHYSENYALAEARRYIAFVYYDGTITCRKVTGFELSGTNEILTLDTTAPTLTNLRSLSLLKFCRLDADTLEIAKRTDDLWIYQWRFRELLESPD